MYFESAIVQYNYQGDNAQTFTNALQSDRHVFIDAHFWSLLPLPIATITASNASELSPGSAAAPIGTVLDLGCGSGHYTNLLAQRYPTAHVWGVDLCESMLSIADTAQGRITYVQQDLTTLKDNPIQNAPASFDLVTSAFCYCHFGTKQSLTRALSVTCNLVRPDGGTVVVILPRVPTSVHENQKFKRYGLYYPELKSMQDFEMLDDGSPVKVELLISESQQSKEKSTNINEILHPEDSTTENKNVSVILDDFYWRPSTYVDILRQVGFSSVEIITADENRLLCAPFVDDASTAGNYYNNVSTRLPSHLASSMSELRDETITDFVSNPTYYCIVARRF